MSVESLKRWDESIKRERRNRRKRILRFLKTGRGFMDNNCVDDMCPTFYCVWCGKELITYEVKDGCIMLEHKEENEACPFEGEGDFVDIGDALPAKQKDIKITINWCFGEVVEKGIPRYCVQCGVVYGKCDHDKGKWWQGKKYTTLVMLYAMGSNLDFEKVYVEYINQSEQWAR